MSESIFDKERRERHEQAIAVAERRREVAAAVETRINLVENNLPCWYWEIDDGHGQVSMHGYIHAFDAWHARRRLASWHRNTKNGQLPINVSFYRDDAMVVNTITGLVRP